MKIFIVGLPKSGRSTVAKAVCQANGWHYIDAMSWIRSTFRGPKENEHPYQYEDEYEQYMTKRLMVNPSFVKDHIEEMMKINASTNKVFVIDGITSPKDFGILFDYREDIIIFLNRTDNDNDYRDHENIGTSVIRDYCFWMSAAGLLVKNRWMELNFKIPGEPSDAIKVMGAQNSVFIVRSIDKAISVVIEKTKGIVDAVSK